MDIIIPLSCESECNNDELRILLRSIEKNCYNLGKIYIATVYAPKWLDQSKVTIVPIEDTEKHNKDANLHQKILGVIEKYDLEKFVFCADDNVFLQKCDLSNLPVTHNCRSIKDLSLKNKWEARVVNTLEFGKKRGIDLKCNFESHCPMEFDAIKVYEGMKSVDYKSQPGLTICTCWKIVSNDCDDIGVDQKQVKVTMERISHMSQKLDDGKLFLGYNNLTFWHGLRKKLFEVFPEKSQYEK